MILSQDLSWRGLIKDRTFDDVRWLDKPQTFYLGVDCSSDSMTIGNLAVIVLARRLQAAGWKAVLLVGGATSMIGDPGGKDEERALKSVQEIESNVAAIRRQMEQLFAGQAFTLVNNYDWFKDLLFLPFLRDIGKHYSMTELMQRDFIVSRMGQGGSGISYAEFSYSLIQGYDYWHLFKQHDVRLQIGASDQWGNMLSGAPLIRKKEGQEVHAMSMPLVINKATGKKFGKSEAGAIWLDAARTTPTQFYQFWINADDEAVADYLKIYTFLDKAAIEDALAASRAVPAERQAQHLLAREITTLVHGQAETETAEMVTNILIGKLDIGAADATVIAAARKELLTACVQTDSSLAAALAASGLAASTSEGRQLVADKAVYINGQAASGNSLQASDFHNGRLLLRKGKALKNTALIELVS